MRKIKTLKKNYEFQNVLAKGKFYIGKQITIYISKIRENYRLIKDELEVGYNIVFLWNRKDVVNNANFFIIKEDMNKLLKRAEILK